MIKNKIVKKEILLLKVLIKKNLLIDIKDYV